MFARAAKAREANAERLQSLVTRWHDLAWAQRTEAPKHQVAWAEHLKRVADDHALELAEQKA
jgi:hypothetical protein